MNEPNKRTATVESTPHGDFLIEAFKTYDGWWRARITTKDGGKVKTETGEYSFIDTPDDITADAAIELAKKMIDIRTVS